MHTGNSEIHENGRRVAEILSQMRDELVQFAQTRITMLRTELRDAWNTTKAAIPLVAIAAVFLWTSFLLLTAALVGLILAAFPHSPYRWFFACLIVGIFWAMIGAGAAHTALRKFRLGNMLPKRTVEVLKADKLWIEAEVRNRV